MHMVQVAFKMVLKTFTRFQKNPEFYDVVIYFWGKKKNPAKLWKMTDSDFSEDIWVQTILYHSKLM